MKELHDGTFVSDDTPTKNIGGLRYVLTQEEVDAKAAEDAANEAAALLVAKLRTAKDELEKSDLVALRCVKAGIAFPADWQNYVTTLRLVISGSVTEMPQQPAYPEGT